MYPNYPNNNYPNPQGSKRVSNAVITHIVEKSLLYNDCLYTFIKSRRMDSGDPAIRQRVNQDFQAIHHRPCQVPSRATRHPI